MDIRDLLKAQKEKADKKKQLQRCPVIVDDDDDFQQPIEKGAAKRKRSKARIQYDSDSDEDPLGKKHKSIVGGAKGSSGHEKLIPSKKRQVTSISEYFGSAPVKQKGMVKKIPKDTSKEAHTSISSSISTVPESPPRSRPHDEQKSDRQLSKKSSSTVRKKPSPVKRTASPSKPETPPAKKLKSLAEKSKQAATSTSSTAVKPTTPPATVGEKKTKSPVLQKSRSQGGEPAERTPVKPPTLQKSSSSDASRGQQYRAYLNRSGPSALGSKTIPEGEPGCMIGLTFVITGVLESLERDEAQELIKKYGGKATQSISKKTSYVVVGSDPGQSKLAKAASFNTKQINEDELLELVRTLPGKTESSTPKSTAKGKQQKRALAAPTSKRQSLTAVKDTTKDTISLTQKSPDMCMGSHEQSKRSPEQLMWVDKYCPESTRHIIGQQGDKSCVKKLLKWLQDWERNYQKGVKKGVANTGALYGRDDGSSFKVALLSGPPGVGKTTAATLACKECNYTFVEMNASSTRSKKSLQEEVADQLKSCSILAYNNNAAGATASESGLGTAVGRRHTLIMDEVDGMAGNEDRGGIQELIKLIKGSHIPIICICNDRQHSKIRSLSNYCYDLRFHKPRVDQIKGAMMSVAFKENVKITPAAMEDLIVASGHDLRQVLHNLSLWSAGSKAITNEQGSSRIKKGLKLGPFDAIKEVFDSHPTNPIAAKSELFFVDYSIMPLFVQENYTSVRPSKAKDTLAVMDCMSKAADAICDANLVEKQVRSMNNWSLLPVQAFFSTVLPGELLQGRLSAKIVFPQWLGNYSRGNKHQRLLQELHFHSGLKTSCNRCELGLEYLQHFHYQTTQPLLSDAETGVRKVVSFLKLYDLTREDWDNIVEMCKLPGMLDIMSQIPPKVKAAFTRTYNSAGILTPYTIDVMPKRKTANATSEADLFGEDTIEEEDLSESPTTDVGNDAMIKVKRKSSDVKKGKGSAKRSKTTTNTHSKKSSNKKKH